MATTPRNENPFADLFGAFRELPSWMDMTDVFEQFRLPGLDLGALVEWQRKDAEALAEANRQIYEGMITIFARRNEMVRDMLAQWQVAFTSTGGKDMFARQSELAGLGIQQATDNIRELSQMQAQVLTNAWKVVQDRMQENMANLQKMLLSR